MSTRDALDRSRPIAPTAEQLHVRVAIADDDAESAGCLGELLCSWGSEVTIAADGDEALRRFPGFRPQLVVLDLSLPGMSGYELAAALRALAGFDEVCIAALTGHDHDEAMRRAEVAGIDEYLVKPVSPPSLRALVARCAIGRSRGARPFRR